MNIEKTGQFIAELRREKQFTQVQLADTIRVSELYCTAFSAHSLARYFVTIILSYTKYSNNYVN